MNTPAIELRGVGKSYNGLKALEGLDLSLEQGRVLGLLGHNGAGKTTAMKLILGINRASTGEVRVFGQSPHGRHADSLRRQIGYLPESVSFYPQLSGREVLVFFGRLKKAPARQIDDLLEQVGLMAAAGRRIKTYSKGMRQRLGLAQALLGEPRLLLLDEPTVGLDPAATRDFYTTLDDLRRRGTSVVLSSHVLAGVERHIDRALILGHGRQLASGTLDELRAQAGLPLLIRVRGRFGNERLQQKLDGEHITTRRVNGSQLELSTPTADKLQTLRWLLADPDIQDIDMETPSLETLYAHFGARDRRQGAQL